MSAANTLEVKRTRRQEREVRKLEFSRRYMAPATGWNRKARRAERREALSDLRNVDRGGSKHAVKLFNSDHTEKAPSITIVHATKALPWRTRVANRTANRCARASRKANR